jgi:hypothetical protein
MEQVLQVARENGVIITKKKFQCGTQVNFAGIQITDKGILPDPKRISAINHFPIPTNVTVLRVFLGLVQQLIGCPA